MGHRHRDQLAYVRRRRSWRILWPRMSIAEGGEHELSPSAIDEQTEVLPLLPLVTCKEATTKREGRSARCGSRDARSRLGGWRRARPAPPRPAVRLWPFAPQTAGRLLWNAVLPSRERESHR